MMIALIKLPHSKTNTKGPTMSLLKNLIKAGTAIVLLSSLGSANATVVEGKFNEHGYDVVKITVAADSTVDFAFTNGYHDPIISLFNAAGAHLVTNDDSNGSVFFHLTQNLTAGNYSFIVSYCCSLVNALTDNTGSGTDGFNSGRFWFGGSATLDSVQAFMAGSGNIPGATYRLTMSNAEVGTADVPEPQSVALFAAALGALAWTRRRGSKAG
jgi:hypothetical protein